MAAATPVPALTARDRSWLLWIDRVRYCTSEQLQGRFPASSLGATRVRLSLLKSRGLLVCREQAPGGGAPCWAVTARGARAVGSPLGRPDWTPGRTAHTLALADAIARFEHAGLPVLTEAELRRDIRWTVRGEHRPDAVILNPDLGPVAVEVERSRKSPAEWERVLFWYRRCGVYEGRVVWLAAPGVDLPLRRVVDAVGMPDCRVFTWGTPAGTGPRRAA